MTTYHATTWEDSGTVLMNRVMADDAAFAAQADVTSIGYTVYDAVDLGTSTATGTLTVANVMFDALQTDARWDVDTTGYNFRWDAPASLFPTGGRTMRIELVLDMASGENQHIVWEVVVKPIYRS